MNLEVEVDGQRHELVPGRSYTVGRSSSSDVVVSDPASKVSRHHLDLRFDGAVWLADDLSSAGSCADGQRFRTVQLQDGMSIRLGQEGSPVIGIGFAGQAAQQKVENEKSVDPNASLGPALSANRVVETSGTVPVGDTALRLELDDTVRTFPTGQTALLGRDASCDLRTDNKLVSGTHCQFSHDGQNWWVEDLGSTRGTFIDGKKVVRSKVEGTLFVMLGGDDAGVPLRVVTAGEHIKPKDRRPLLVASAALLLVVVAGAAAALFWPDGGGNSEQIAALQEQLDVQQQLTEEQIAEAQAQSEAAIAEANAAGGAGNDPNQLMAARLSTALIFVPDESGEITSTGSGALVSDDGLVLTNIHVVLPALTFERTGAPDFAGGFDPETVIVAFPGTDGGPADLYFVAEQVATHPAHDAALIRVVEGFDGETLDDLPEPLPIGDSSELRAGDEIAVVGYPGIAATQRVSVSLSNFQSFQPCAGTENDAFFGCLRNYDEGYLNMAGETLSAGSSGGPVLHSGEIVGIQLGFNDVQDLAVPIDLIVEELALG